MKMRMSDSLAGLKLRLTCVSSQLVPSSYVFTSLWSMSLSFEGICSTVAMLHFAVSMVALTASDVIHIDGCGLTLRFHALHDADK